VNDAPITRQAARTSLQRAITSSLISPAEASLVIGSALLSVLSFPDFDLWFLAWIGLVPLLIVVARTASFRKAFVAGWIWGTIFFYGTCWWLAYPMIHSAQIRAWIAYPLLLLPIVFVALFPALACAGVSLVIKRFGEAWILLTPIVWVSFEWLRYCITGQLWNAIGYSQAYQPAVIQSARWGGVYAISFGVVAANSAIVFALAGPTLKRIVLCAFIVASIVAVIAFEQFETIAEPRGSTGDEVVVAVQPNVPVDLAGDSAQMDQLLGRHFAWSGAGLHKRVATDANSLIPRLVIWPESPMNFSYSGDPHLRQVVGDFARTHQTSILLNSLEPAKDGGDQNSAILVNEKGEMSARYDKIRLMPFGEYVPLPHWLPGASSVRGIVGEFTPGSSYTLMPLGALRAGVFICIEAAHPGIARSFTNEGADVLINISNDGYLGPTPVMRQHLANAVFRAVENDRDVVRVTNSGITAYISSTGAVNDSTTGFHEDVRTWTISKGANGSTFYSRHGDIFVYGCALISLGIISASFMRRRVSEARP
jgi:apolipoprotein N-acyltransferase